MRRQHRHVSLTTEVTTALADMLTVWNCASVRGGASVSQTVDNPKLCFTTDLKLAKSHLTPTPITVTAANRLSQREDEEEEEEAVVSDHWPKWVKTS